MPWFYFIYYTAFIDNNCKIIEMMIIMSKNDNRDKMIIIMLS